MVNYQNGKVYILRSRLTNRVYVGSTTQSLAIRKAGHIQKYKSWKNGTNKAYITSFLIIEDGEVEITLVELKPCDTKEELTKAEREWIKKTECVNKIVPLRSDAEYKQDKKEEIQAYNKDYYYKNLDRYKEWRTRWYEENKERKSQYYHDNREKILARNAEKIQCECGGMLQKGNRYNHNRTKRHQTYLAHTNSK